MRRNCAELGLALVFLAVASAVAQNNPIPLLYQPLTPTTVAPGSAAFTLTIHGTGFASSAVVNWNGSPRLTEVISSSQVSASISAGDVATASTASITVTNPAPGGGVSNVVFFPVRRASATLGMAISNPFASVGGVAVGDFNNDGKYDVAWVDSSHALNVALGNGKGGFQAPIKSNVILAPTQMATGDFNGDGKLDLAVIDRTDIFVLLGNGDGTFTLSYSTQTPPLSLNSLAVADLNHDGHLDVYVSGQELGPMYFVTFWGNGDGTLGSGGFYETGVYPKQGYLAGVPAIGDFNGDGYLDLVIPGYANTGGEIVDVWLGDVFGNFTELAVVPGAVGLNASAADVNNDGNLDVVTDTGCVLLGNGNGTFGSCIDFPVGGQAMGFGDFNGDGHLDIAAASNIQLGAGDGTFTALQFYGGTGGGFNGGIADFNDDGKLDVALPDGFLLLQTTVDLTPFSLAFGSQNVGTKSAAQTATLSNVGTSALTINKISVTGTNAGQFTQTNNCGTSLAAASSCTISIVFAPTKTGALAGALTVSYVGTASPQTVALSGTGLGPPTVTLLPTSLKFATQLVGTSSAAQTATLTNTGTQTVTISDIATSGAFSETNNCGTSLGISGSCQIQVVFAPTAKGLAGGTLIVTDNAARSPQKVALSGVGTVVTLSPVGVNFGSQKVGTTSAKAPITLTNNGSTALAIAAISIAGTNAGDFAETNNCGASVAAHGACTINVTFKPTAIGARSGSVSVTDNGGGSPQSVPLTGTGT